jgi:hypothetical protein
MSQLLCRNHESPSQVQATVSVMSYVLCHYLIGMTSGIQNGRFILSTIFLASFLIRSHKLH